MKAICLIAFVLVAQVCCMDLGHRSGRVARQTLDQLQIILTQGAGQPPGTVPPQVNAVPATNDATYRRCLVDCPVTSEYNPICGTDYVKYDNPGKLECAVSCGRSVTMLRMGKCPARSA